jgi:hypothetical protein
VGPDRAHASSLSNHVRRGQKENTKSTWFCNDISSAHSNINKCRCAADFPITLGFNVGRFRRPGKCRSCDKLRALAPVAQLDRVLGYEPRGRGFESCRARHTFRGLHKLQPLVISARASPSAPVTAHPSPASAALRSQGDFAYSTLAADRAGGFCSGGSLPSPFCSLRSILNRLRAPISGAWKRRLDVR